MGIENPVTILPSRLDWPDAVRDIRPIRKDRKRLRLVAGATGLERLDQFPQLEALWCFGINQEALAYICKCASLESLYIDTLKSDQFGCILNLRSLKVLSIDSCSKIDSLGELSDLRNLEGLAILNFRNVHGVSPLSKLTNLQQLAIAGSIWTRTKIKSLKPLSSLRNLKYLHLTSLKAEDESLKPLAELYQLEKLEIANYYPMEEFAWLSGRLKNTKCTWFRPYIEATFECSKCGEHTLVMLTGKGKPNLCKECDGKRLERHIAEFERIAANAA